MASSAESKRTIRFAEFELDLRAGELRADDYHVILPEKPFQILTALLERPGEMVTREELVKRLWPAGTFVDFNLGLNKAVNRLREALRDSAEQPRFIETFPKRGYRFVASISGDAPTDSDGTSPDVLGSRDTSEQYPASKASTGQLGISASASAVAVSNPSLWKAALLTAAALAIALVAVYALHAWRTRSLEPDIEKIQVTKLTDSGRVTLVAISPDGRYVCYSLRQPSGLGLWLRQVSTGSDTQILPADAISFEGLTFSPDGNYIYYVRGDKNDPGFKYLYVMPVLGGPSKLLVKDIDSPINFSPNGNKFVYTRGMPGPNTTEVRVANGDGSENHLLTTVPGIYPGFQPGATWSPDGRTIAVSFQRAGRQSFVLYAVSASDGGMRELHSSSNSIGRPLWLPEGNMLLLVMGDQNGRGQLWTISYPEAEIRRVTNDLTDYDTRSDLTRDAKTMAAVANEIDANVWVAPAEHLDEAKQITSLALPLILISDSPDGRLLAIGKDGRIWSMRADGTERVPFTDAKDVDTLRSCGQYVVIAVRRATATEFLRVDSDGANPTKLASGDLASWSLGCTRDGKSVFYADLRPPHAIWRIPIEGGTPVKIGEGLGDMLLGPLLSSPDQRFLVYNYEEYTPTPVIKIAILPANGGPPVRFIPASGGALALQWSVDGKSLQYMRTENGASNIWERPLDGGKLRQLTKFPTGRIFDFHWSLDGKRLLLTRGEVSSDVVLLSNLR